MELKISNFWTSQISLESLWSHTWGTFRILQATYRVILKHILSLKTVISSLWLSVPKFRDYSFVLLTYFLENFLEVFIFQAIIKIFNLKWSHNCLQSYYKVVSIVQISLDNLYISQNEKLEAIL